MYKSIIFAVCSVAVLSNAQDCSLPKKPARDCCPGFLPSGLSPAIMNECKMPPEASPLNLPPCPVASCILKKMNILGADGNVVDRATFVSAMDSQYTGDFKQMIGPVYDTCISQSTATTCPQMTFLLCTKGQMFKNCPASVAVNSPECLATKTFFDTCVIKE